MSAKKSVLTPNAPQPIGPYSQAIRAGDWLYISGQIGFDPSTGNLKSPEIEGQAKQVLENLRAVAQAGGAKLDQVVKTTIFLKSMGDFPKVNEIYATFFTGITPARSTVEVSRLPKDVLVEIEAVVYLGN